MSLRLVPFTAELLPLVQPWFRHPEVDRRLGGPAWPARELRLVQQDCRGEEFRGRRVLRMHSWVAVDDTGSPVAKIGGDVYDRWTRYLGEGPDGPVVDREESGPAMGLAYVVDPSRWRQGLGRRSLLAVLASPEVADVRIFVAGIEADNVASSRCAASAGFAPDDPQPDGEDMVYFFHRRPDRPPGPRQSAARAARR